MWVSDEPISSGNNNNRFLKLIVTVGIIMIVYMAIKVLSNI